MPDQIEQSLFNFESKDQLPKKKDRTLIKDLFSYNWVYGNKEARLILQWGIYIFLLPIL